MILTKHAVARAVSRLRFERILARAKLAWLCDRAPTIPKKELPSWFEPIPDKFAPNTTFRRTNYVGTDTILVVVQNLSGDALTLTTVVTEPEVSTETGAIEIARAEGHDYPAKDKVNHV